MHKETRHITTLILDAAKVAQRDDPGTPEPTPPDRLNWPITCTVGPGLEGAIACESRIGYVNGSAGRLVYRGYDIFDLCAHSTFEEVSYLITHGHLPNRAEYKAYCRRLAEYRSIPLTLRNLMAFPIQELNTMAALRLGNNLLRQRKTWRDSEAAQPCPEDALSIDEDSIAMETRPRGEHRAVYEFPAWHQPRPEQALERTDDAVSRESCERLVASMPTITACIARVRQGLLPIDPHPTLGHAANFLYMLTGRVPTAEEARVLDVALILHADHGMNASTFAAMVVASTLADIYFSVGAGIGALSGPLHGGANELVLHTLREIGTPGHVKAWFAAARARKARIPGFGHRVYKTYDPRARVLGPLAHHLCGRAPATRRLLGVATALEKTVVTTLGREKRVFPNVDFYSGLVYASLGIPTELFTPIFAVSRVAGWTARVLEYLGHNRIFRPRALYIGELGKTYTPISKRG